MIEVSFYREDLMAARRSTRLDWLENQTNRENLVCPNRDFETACILRRNRLLIPFERIRGDDLAYR